MTKVKPTLGNPVVITSGFTSSKGSVSNFESAEGYVVSTNNAGEVILVCNIGQNIAGTGELKFFVDSQEVKSAHTDDTVSIKTYPGEGYALTDLRIEDSNGDTVPFTKESWDTVDFEFKMPSGDVTVLAKFETGVYSLTAEITGEGSGTLKFYVNDKEVSSAKADDTATVKVVPESGEGYGSILTMMGYSYNSGAGGGNFEQGDYAFTMPDAPVTVTATFDKVTITGWTYGAYGETGNGPKYSGDNSITYKYCLAKPEEGYPPTTTQNSGAAQEYGIPKYVADTAENHYTLLAQSLESSDAYSGETKIDFYITKADLKVAANEKTIAYGDDPANNGVTYSGFITGDDESNSVTGTLAYAYSYDPKVDGFGLYTITPSGLSSRNYSITCEDGALTVEQRPVTFTGVSETKDYTGSEIEISDLTVEGLISGHTHNVTFSATGTDVGEYEGTITDVADVVIMSDDTDVTENYDVNVENGTLTIKQDPSKKLTVSLDDASFEYDGRAHALPKAATTNASTGETEIEYSKDGKSWTDDLASLTAKDVADSCTIQVRASNSSYANEATGSAKLTITKRVATITVSNASKTAGEADPEFTGKVVGIVAPSDLGSVSYIRTNSDEEAGTYKGVLSATYTKNANYDVTIVAGDFTIKASPEKVTYKVVSGDGFVVNMGSGESLSFTFKRSVDDETAFDHFTGIKVDGRVVPKKSSGGNVYYTTERGSVIVTLQPVFLEKLSSGKHTIAASFDDGDDATASFELKKAASPKPIPQTGDPSDSVLMAELAVASVILLVVGFSLRRLRCAGR